MSKSNMSHDINFTIIQRCLIRKDKRMTRISKQAGITSKKAAGIIKMYLNEHEEKIINNKIQFGSKTESYWQHEWDYWTGDPEKDNPFKKLKYSDVEFEKMEKPKTVEELKVHI